MEWNKKLQLIIDHVEHNLQAREEPVDREEISRIAGCSFDFFQKVFSYMNGMGFAEYIRFRKLTLAGYDLKSTDMKIVDISYKYGYNSPTSFTKAFQQFHGIPPKEARENEVKLRVMPKLQIAQRRQFSWQVQRKAGFRLIGKTIRVSCADGEHYEKIPGFWSECQKDGTYPVLRSLDTGAQKGMFGLFSPCDEDVDEMEYSIMVISDKSLPAGLTGLELPEQTWAVFDCRGPVPQAIQEGWKYLNGEWLVRYPFRHAPCPELEWYSDGNPYGEDYLSQIWIPVTGGNENGTFGLL
ncbi:AraC family transcriptional regulator [Enterocloster hominis (ex Hitch et al. 2024)]|uniref:AraC family transcriptional regulator n=1 Tax=Enterocloster hominis (ex Hitch et al. 2024) TaxID=1917870 RepID=A0ABV1D935_9FIRM